MSKINVESEVKAIESLTREAMAYCIAIDECAYFVWVDTFQNLRNYKPYSIISKNASKLDESLYNAEINWSKLLDKSLLCSFGDICYDDVMPILHNLRQAYTSCFANIRTEEVEVMSWMKLCLTAIEYCVYQYQNLIERNRRNHHADLSGFLHKFQMNRYCKQFQQIYDDVWSAVCEKNPKATAFFVTDNVEKHFQQYTNYFQSHKNITDNITLARKYVDNNTYHYAEIR